MISNNNPNYLLKLIFDKIPQGSYFLDLGCGNGSDTIFMAENGFNVTAIEKSEIEVKNIQNIIKNKNLGNINIINDNVLNFDIQKDKYNIIQSLNLLQFLQREEALNLIGEIQDRILPNGFIILSAFTIENPIFKNDRHPTYFDFQEMLKLFKDFRIIYYFEGLVFDKPHKNAEYPHQHGIVKIIAQKYIND